MTNVHHLPPPDGLLDEAVPAFDDAAAVKAAQQAFAEAVETGCSFADCLGQVYLAGIASVVGAPKRRAPRKAATPPCPFDQIVAAYHAQLPEFPSVGVQSGKLWEKRKAAMREFWVWVMTSVKPDGTRRAETAQQGTSWFAQYFERVRSNAFLMGETPRSEGHKNWRPDFDYLLTSSGMKQVLEKTVAAG